MSLYTAIMTHLYRRLRIFLLTLIPALSASIGMTSLYATEVTNYGPVSPTENLRIIASNVRGNLDIPLQRIMREIRASNPEALIAENSIQIRSGHILKVPAYTTEPDSPITSPDPSIQTIAPSAVIAHLPVNTMPLQDNYEPISDHSALASRSQLIWNIAIITSALVLLGVLFVLINYFRTAGAELSQRPAERDSDANKPVQEPTSSTDEKAPVEVMPEVPSMDVSLRESGSTGKHSTPNNGTSAAAIQAVLRRRDAGMDAETQLNPTLKGFTTSMAVEVDEGMIENISLAKTYLDLGDFSHAKRLLEEVVEQGDDEYARQAQELLHELKKAEKFASSFHQFMADEAETSENDSQKVLNDLSHCFNSLDDDVSRQYQALLLDEQAHESAIEQPEQTGQSDQADPARQKIFRNDQLQRLATRFQANTGESNSSKLALATVHIGMKKYKQAKIYLYQIIESEDKEYAIHAKNLLNHILSHE